MYIIMYLYIIYHKQIVVLSFHEMQYSNFFSDFYMQRNHLGLFRSGLGLGILPFSDALMILLPLAFGKTVLHK